LANDGAEVINSAIDVINKWNMEVSDCNPVKTAVTETKLCHRQLISSMADFLKIEI
jgi:hypothetical protein